MSSQTPNLEQARPQLHAVAAGVHDEIGGPGAGLGVNKIVDGVEGDGETIVLLLFSCSSVICFWRLLIKAKTDRMSATKTP